MKSLTPKKSIDFEEWALSLAALFSALNQVKSLALKGHWDEPLATELINSLFVMNPNSVLDVYPNPTLYLCGYRLLSEILKFDGRLSAYQHELKYALGTRILARRLSKQVEKQHLLQQRLKRIHQQAQHFSPTHGTVLTNMSDLYTEVFSTMRYRIMVLGNPKYLQVDWHVRQIRTLLLAAIRAMVLFQQLEGGIYKLIFYRKPMLQVINKKLRTLL